MLPEIRSSSQVYGRRDGRPWPASRSRATSATSRRRLFGQTCFEVGEAKNTYGTGNFMLLNTGTRHRAVQERLLTTLGYKLGDEPAVYCLEGSIAITGALVQWLRDNLGLIATSAEVEDLAKTVEDNGGVYFVPAFSGLFAPYWRGDARGVIVGLTRYVNKGHIARAVARGDRVADAGGARRDEGRLRRHAQGAQGRRRHGLQRTAHAVPGGRPGRPGDPSDGRGDHRARCGVRRRPGGRVLEGGTRTSAPNWGKDKEWQPSMDAAERDKEYALWKKAVTRTFDWVE